MFDRLWVPCCKCGAAVEFQSKGGNCCLVDYYANNVPLDVLADAKRDGDCHSCGAYNLLRYSLLVYCTPSTEVPFGPQAEG